jgi:TM2 domain-containing membrane protein YozV/ribosomal protein L40E
VPATTESSNGQLSFCKDCGAHNAEGARICANCGATLQTPIPSSVLLQRKKTSTTILLAGFVGVIFMGVGHLYLGRMGRGTVILFAGMFTGVLFYAAMITAYFLIGYMFGIARISLWIWQIYDAHKLTKRYNGSLESIGKPPW